MRTAATVPRSPTSIVFPPLPASRLEAAGSAWEALARFFCRGTPPAQITHRDPVSGPARAVGRRVMGGWYNARHPARRGGVHMPADKPPRTVGEALEQARA